MRPRRPRTLPLAAAFGLAGLIALSGCAPQPAYDDATAAELHERVVSVGRASAAGDWDGALDALDAMAAEVEQAEADGRIGPQRKESILLAIRLVRQDLRMAIDAAANAAERERLEGERAALQAQLDRLEAERAEEERRARDEQVEDADDGADDGPRDRADAKDERKDGKGDRKGGKAGRGGKGD